MSEGPLSPEILVPWFGQYLVERSLVSQQDLERALEYQDKLRARGDQRLIGQVLVDLGIIDPSIRDAAVTERITQLRKELIEANQQLERRVEERTAELQRAMTKLAEINKLKANLVANISHELRTPLTHLKGYLELLLAGDLGPITEQQQSALAIMERSSERLSRLIDDLILFSVSERDKMQLHIEVVRLQQVCAQALQKAGLKARERNIQLALDCPPDLPPASADEEKISWVITQFLDNAIKFTQPGGKVTLRASRSRDCIDITVQDSGMGIPESQINQIFDSFYQLDGSSTRKAGGTGLGLALAKKIVESHGAAIRVTSEVGKGSCFTFSLKLHAGRKDKSGAPVAGSD